MLSCYNMRNIIVLFIIQFSLLHTITADSLPACQPEDFHYEYTECDSAGGRWRVSVPKPNTCVDGAPNPPVRGRGCEFTCDAGQFLNLASEEQQCESCPAGTYSLGGGVRYETWDHLPKEFSVKQESFVIPNFMRHVLKDDDDLNDNNCTQSSAWNSYGSYISSVPGECSSSLLYSANLVRPGRISFMYQFNEKINGMFQFMVQNEQCQSMSSKSSNRWPQQTEDDGWNTISAPLTTGINILEWKTMSMEMSGTNNPTMQKAIKIKEIEITGVAYTSECSACIAGTHSAGGASECETCPPNTYSHAGDAQCSPCDTNTQYSGEGADKCTDRPPCTENDYFSYNVPCNNNQTHKVYSWTQPQVCLVHHAASVTLPADSSPKPCPPCNAGMMSVNGSCVFCSPGTFSPDGRGPCQSCPASTAPKAGINIQWWNSLPENANITTSCLSSDDRGCNGKLGWISVDDSSMQTSQGHADDAYIVLGLSLGGFKGQPQILFSKPVTVANISFVFQQQCAGDCIMFFMMQTQGRTTVIESWRGTIERMSYSYAITSVDEVRFSWAFQKQPEDDVGADDIRAGTFKQKHTYARTSDVAYIYSLDVTNTLTGGASACEMCPQGVSTNGCIPCPEGHYVDLNTTRCMQCPNDTVVHGINPWGPESCVQCGEGLTQKSHTHCTSDCTYTTMEGKSYDFSRLSGVHSIMGSRLFTTSGTQYYHLFNISLCAGDSIYPKVSCYDNITFTEESYDQILNVSICQTTIIPPRETQNEPTFSTQPLSLGDTLVNVTTNGTSLNMANRLKVAGFPTTGSESDIHFTYLSEMSTTSCLQGRTTIITLRCDEQGSVDGTITLPPHCPDGTCDGCNFHLLWTTRVACPACTQDDYQEVIGQCINGNQEVHYIPKNKCVQPNDNMAPVKSKKCSVLPFWAMIAVYVCTGMGIVMLCLLCYCWKKNRKLEYRYMKLVGGSSDQDQELPAAETCALDEGEDEEFDSVKFQQQSKGKRLLNKIKGITSKDKDNDTLQDINQEHSSLLY